MSDDLKERLRAKRIVTGHKRTWPYSDDQREMVLVAEYGPDPDAQEAAARIAALEAEVARLREALEGA